MAAVPIELALEALLARLDREEPGQSAHWKLMMSSASWDSTTAGPRHGLGEFIGWNWKRGLLHWLMQAPFRRMGDAFPAFAEIHANARRNAKRHWRVLDMDDLRQELSLACVRRHLDLSAGAVTIAVIGDGYGRLASLLLDTLPLCRVVLVNLSRALFVDLMSLQRLRPGLKVALAEDAVADATARVVAIPASSCELLASIPVDGAFNISSMQEMHPSTIAEYFRLLRASPAPATWFYCANASEKRLPDGAVARFEDYPWSTEDDVLLDELCPWAQENYRIWPPGYFPRLYHIRHRLAWLRKRR